MTVFMPEVPSDEVLKIIPWGKSVTLQEHLDRARIIYDAIREQIAREAASEKA
jgi:hypothetical protein